MTIAVHSRNRKNDYHKVFEAALRLPLDEQRRLRDELAKLSDVRLVAPANSKSARCEGKALADQVRAPFQGQVSPENADTPGVFGIRLMTTRNPCRPGRGC